MERINEIRSVIDDIDDEILDLIEMRQNLTQQIQNWKELSDLNPIDENRQEEILNRLKSKNYQVSNDLVNSIWNSIFKDTLK